MGIGERISDIVKRSLGRDDEPRRATSSRLATARDYLITGIPRSGTSLVCRLLDDQDESVVVNEPREPMAAVRVRRYDAFILEFHAHLRSEILAGRPILNKLTDGRVSSNTHGADRRQPYHPAVHSPGFLLGTKDTLQYLTRLDELRGKLQGMHVLVCIRDPRAAIASWKASFAHLAHADVTGLLSRGALGSGRSVDRRAIAALQATADVQVRRSLLWCHLASVIRRNRDWVSIIRYEDLLTDARSVLEGLVTMLDSSRSVESVVLEASIRQTGVAAGMDPVEARLVWDICAEEASHFGYDRARSEPPCVSP